MNGNKKNGSRRHESRIPYGAPGHPFPKGCPHDSKAAEAFASHRAPDSRRHVDGGTGKSSTNRGGGTARGTRFPAPLMQPFSAAGRRPRHVSRSEVQFIYQDEDIIAVLKPEGLPVIAPDGSRALSLYDIVTDEIRRTNPHGRAAVVHRLDRESSGVLVFAKNADAKRRLMEHWAELAVERRYTALVEGELPQETGQFKSWLASVGDNRVRVVEEGTRGAHEALTDYRVLGRGAGLSLVELSLETGRKHQIRAQLAAAGHPIVGDFRYGAKCDTLGRLGLHATLLVLRHPETGALLRFESPAPESFKLALAEKPRSGAVANSGQPRAEQGRPGKAHSPKKK